jgi:hypothetical protein
MKIFLTKKTNMATAEISVVKRNKAVVFEIEPLANGRSFFLDAFGLLLYLYNRLEYK